MLIDTSAIISYFNDGEENHRTIVNTVKIALSQGDSLQVLDTVLEEVLAVFRKRISKDLSVRVAKFLIGRRVVEIIPIGQGLIKESVKLFVKYRGKYSYVDCSLAAWAKANQENIILAVDKHFSELGLAVIP